MLFKKKQTEPTTTKRKSVIAIDKHKQLLTGTKFEKCIPCSGCTGKINPDGNHLCSNVGPTASPVTPIQAQACKDGIPPNKVQKKKHFRVQNRPPTAVLLAA